MTQSFESDYYIHLRKRSLIFLLLTVIVALPFIALFYSKGISLLYIIKYMLFLILFSQLFYSTIFYQQDRYNDFCLEIGFTEKALITTHFKKSRYIRYDEVERVNVIRRTKGSIKLVTLTYREGLIRLPYFPDYEAILNRLQEGVPAERIEY